MQLWQILQENSTLAFVFFAVLGLCVGSFLNVVIHRMPLAMTNEWRRGSIDLLTSQEDISKSLIEPIADIVNKDSVISLSTPPSQCPHCTQRITWYQNIPIVSWILLAGKCSNCKQPISIRYPIIELTTALLSILVIYQFGVTLPAIAALILTWTLIALTVIDFDTQLLPDRLTFPLAGLGLAVNTQSWFVSPSTSIWGLLLGFLCLWVVAKLFYLITKKSGMGEGDFKLLAALGAWLGPMALPLIILLSSLVGSIVGLFLLNKHGKSKPFAYGPYIAIAGIFTLLFGQQMLAWYLGLF